jgi:hypothetical protein
VFLAAYSWRVDKVLVAARISASARKSKSIFGCPKEKAASTAAFGGVADEEIDQRE